MDLMDATKLLENSSRWISSRCQYYIVVALSLQESVACVQTDRRQRRLIKRT